MALPREFFETLDGGLAELGVELAGSSREKLATFTERLVQWNQKVNLTAVTRPAEIAEIHLVDSLALLRTLGTPATLLDVGSGAGLPGLALSCARPAIEVTCCDPVRKKVAFLKAVSAELGLRARAVERRAGGEPEREGLPRCEAVVSRALVDPARWLLLGRAYLTDGGELFAMLGREASPGTLEAAAKEAGLELESVDRFTLPRSRAARAVARFRVRR